MFGDYLSLQFSWGDRKEGLDACVRRVSDFFKRLRQISPLFERWYEGDDESESGFGEELNAATLTDERLYELLESDMIYPDVGDKQFPDSGYNVSLYSQASFSSHIHLSLRCDHYTVPNLCLLESRVGTDLQEQLADPKLLKSLQQLVIDIWNPDQGVVFSSDIVNQIDPESLDVTSGWMIYRRTDKELIPEIPGLQSSEVIPSRGHLLTVTDTIEIPPKPETIEAIRKAWEGVQEHYPL